MCVCILTGFFFLSIVDGVLTTKKEKNRLWLEGLRISIPLLELRLASLMLCVCVFFPSCAFFLRSCSCIEKTRLTRDSRFPLGKILSRKYQGFWASFFRWFSLSTGDFRVFFFLFPILSLVRQHTRNRLKFKCVCTPRKAHRNRIQITSLATQNVPVLFHARKSFSFDIDFENSSSCKKKAKSIYNTIHTLETAIFFYYLKGIKRRGRAACRRKCLYDFVCRRM